MSSWIKEKEGNVTLVHHSTSSQIEIIVEYKGDTNTFWLDYYEYGSLEKLILKIGQPQLLELKKQWANQIYDDAFYKGRDTDPLESHIIKKQDKEAYINNLTIENK